MNDRQQLKAAGLVANMSRKGNCYDNAAMEAFWSTLKREDMARAPLVQGPSSEGTL